MSGENSLHCTPVGRRRKGGGGGRKKKEREKKKGKGKGREEGWLGNALKNYKCA